VAIPEEASARNRRNLLVVGAVILVAGLIAGTWYFRSRSAKALTQQDTVVLADFANTTGDRVFDGTLKQALAVDLEQSPFLRVLPPARVRETLRFMGRSPDEGLTYDLARELCLRSGSKATLAGAIASLGSEYVITLNAVNCQTGDSLAQVQAQAPSKEKVLASLGTAVSDIRGKLGESLASIQKFDVPIEQVTTASLEALKAFALGNAEFYQGQEIASLPFFRHAVELDPNFAVAIARTGVVYSNAGELELAKDHFRKAYELRDRVSEREKFYITEHYYETVTGELDKEIETLQLYERTYPNDPIPSNNLCVAFESLGQFDKGAEECRKSLQIDPNSSNGYTNLGYSYSGSGHPDEARQIIEQGLVKVPEGDGVHWVAFWLALAQGRSADAQRELAWAKGKPREYQFLGTQSRLLQEQGKLRDAREILQQAMNIEKGENLNEIASGDLGALAVIEADFGVCDRARQDAGSLTSHPTRVGSAFAGFAFATCGDAGKAEALAADLDKKNPLETYAQKIDIPQIRARMELQRGNGAKAVELLRAAEGIEFGYVGQGVPVYVRGLAYLQQKQGAQAAAEFQKILDHRGALGASPYMALARLGLARASALSGDLPRARTAYQDFFAAWKEADPDIPILQQARAEYAKLK
jgi:tetratricopeptide (TPR) repeat protein